MSLALLYNGLAATSASYRTSARRRGRPAVDLDGYGEVGDVPARVNGQVEMLMVALGEIAESTES
jgi:hypothetical protein